MSARYVIKDDSTNEEITRGGYYEVEVEKTGFSTYAFYHFKEWSGVIAHLYLQKTPYSNVKIEWKEVNNNYTRQSDENVRIE